MPGTPGNGRVDIHELVVSTLDGVKRLFSKSCGPRIGERKTGCEEMPGKQMRWCWGTVEQSSSLSAQWSLAWDFPWGCLYNLFLLSLFKKRELVLPFKLASYTQEVPTLSSRQLAFLHPELHRCLVNLVCVANLLWISSPIPWVKQCIYRIMSFCFVLFYWWMYLAGKTRTSIWDRLSH